MRRVVGGKVRKLDGEMLLLLLMVGVYLSASLPLHPAPRGNDMIWLPLLSTGCWGEAEAEGQCRGHRGGLGER